MSENGSVLLQVDARPEAIICAPGLLDDRYGEREYIVDRRKVRGVRVVERFPQLSFEELDSLRRKFNCC